VRSTVEQIAHLVREAIAAYSALDVEALNDSTPLVDMNMDSLTLVTVVSHVENAVGTTFTAKELAEVLRARDVGELAAAVARKVEARAESNSDELSRNARCVADDDRF
jgi:acyl carrier protein